MKSIIGLLCLVASLLFAQTGFAQWEDDGRNGRDDSHGGQDNGNDRGDDHGRNDRRGDGNNDLDEKFGSPDVLVPVYRSANSGSYIFTLNPREGVRKGYSYEGVAFYLHQQSAANRVALYRCIEKKTYFVSTDQNCKGQTRDVVLGHAEVSMSQNAQKTIYSCSNDKAQLVTLNNQECLNNGFKVDGILGYTINK
ncbi:hypothetical protein D3C87_241870 [compost metagenome]